MNPEELRVSADFITSIYMNLAKLKNLLADYELIDRDIGFKLHKQETETGVGAEEIGIAFDNMYQLGQSIYRHIRVLHLDYLSLLALKKVPKDDDLEKAFKAVQSMNQELKKYDKHVPQIQDVEDYTVALNRILISKAMAQLLESTSEVMARIYQQPAKQ